MSDATSLAEDFASGRSDPVQAPEQALDQASQSAAVFICLTAERARREARAGVVRDRAPDQRRRRAATIVADSRAISGH